VSPPLAAGRRDLFFAVPAADPVRDPARGANRWRRAGNAPFPAKDLQAVSAGRLYPELWHSMNAAAAET